MIKRSCLYNMFCALGSILIALPAWSQTTEQAICEKLEPVILQSTNRFKPYQIDYDAELEEYTAKPIFSTATSCMIESDFSFYRCDWSFSADGTQAAQALFLDLKSKLQVCFPGFRARDFLDSRFDAEKKTFEYKKENVEVSAMRRTFTRKRTGVKTIFVSIQVNRGL